MDLEMVLNELSMYSAADNVLTARQRMSELIRTLSKATESGIQRVLRVHANFHSTVLAPDYPLSKWRNDSEVEHDEKVFLKLLVTKMPFLKGIADPNILDKTLLSEFRVADNLVEGLGVAFLLEALAISLKSDTNWETSLIRLNRSIIEESTQVKEDEIEVVHACTTEHILEHTLWIENRLKTSFRDGSDLWERRDQFFPSLIFCENVGDELKKIDSGNQVLRQIIKCLFELEHSAANWTEGPFNYETVPRKISPESESTLNKYSQERTFLCPDGEYRLFELHVRLTPFAWRVHFFLDGENHKMIVGYIGKHLPIATAPT